VLLRLFRPKHYPLILIEQSLCREFDRLVDECRGHTEQGGILIGGRRGPHIDVVEMTFPAAADEAGYYHFTRKDNAHQDAAYTAWIRTGQTLSYVGEWHTHPSGPVKPSSTDIGTWRTVVRQQGRPCVFVLATPAGWGVFGAAGRKDVREMHRLQQGSTGDVFGSEIAR
jgi:integrative and conjugative element protein (TIGR02256 family)